MNKVKINLVKKSYEELQEEVTKLLTDKFILKTQLEAYENMRKEVIDYIKSTNFDSEDNIVAKKVGDSIIGGFILENKIPNDLLNILNKVGDTNEID